MNRFFFILLLLINFSVLSQNSFQVTFTSPLNEYFSSMAEDNQGNIIAVGAQRQYNQMETNKAVIWRISKNGDTLSKSFFFGDTSSQFVQVFFRSNCYCTVFGSLTVWSEGKSFILILDLDSNLNIIHQKVIQPYPYKSAGCYKLIKTNTAYYGLGGAINLNDTLNPSIIKFDNNFNIVKIQTYPFYNGVGIFSGQFRDAIFSPDSSQIWSFAESFTPGDNSLYDMLIVDTLLDFIELKRFPIGSYPNFGDFRNSVNVKWITDSTFLVGGSYWDQHYPDPIQFDIGFAEIDSTLAYTAPYTIGKQDTMDYGGLLTTFDFVKADSIYFTGTKRLVGGFFPQQVSWIYTGMFNRNNELYFERFYGGDAHYWVYSMIRTTDGGFLISGLRFDYLTQDSERDVFFLKLNQEGLITGNKDIRQCPYRPFAIFPNPGNSVISIDLVVNKAQLCLFDLSGKQIMETSLFKGTNQLNLENLRSGNYIFKLTNPQGEIFTQKWIKQ